jgi:hypothetical protein
LSSLASLFDLRILDNELFPIGIFRKLNIALVYLRKEAFSGQCGLLVFQLIYELGKAGDFTETLKLLSFY